ncbi:hypothetical protein HRbin28_01669 [bacterium HR28]|nr:hypothetical protein HRbin28_01669 [bacterium HR28]
MVLQRRSNSTGPVIENQPWPDAPQQGDEDEAWQDSSEIGATIETAGTSSRLASLERPGVWHKTYEADEYSIAPTGRGLDDGTSPGSAVGHKSDRTSCMRYDPRDPASAFRQEPLSPREHARVAPGHFSTKLRTTQANRGEGRWPMTDTLLSCNVHVVHALAPLSRATPVMGGSIEVCYQDVIARPGTRHRAVAPGWQGDREKRAGRTVRCS